MKTVRYFFVSIIVIGGLAGCQKQENLEANVREKNISEVNPIRLGYCPTMEAEAQILLRKNTQITLVRYDSAATALLNLEKGNVQLAIVGRTASFSEITKDMSTIRLADESYTLIGKTKGFLTTKELAEHPVHTCISREQEANLFPDLRLTYSPCNYQDGNTWLVSWNEIPRNMELVIPIDDRGDKVKKYRTPILYANDSVLETIVF